MQLREALGPAMERLQFERERWIRPGPGVASFRATTMRAEGEIALPVDRASSSRRAGLERREQLDPGSFVLGYAQRRRPTPHGERRSRREALASRDPSQPAAVVAGLRAGGPGARSRPSPCEHAAV